jgi:DNA primase
MVLNHPWLLHDHGEELAAVEFRHADAERIKAALIDISAHDSASDSANDWPQHEPPDHAAIRADHATMRAELARRGLDQQVARIEKAITTPAVWATGPEAAAPDVVMTWHQLFTLHRQWHSLIKELRDAEQALGRDATEANYSWLQDVKARLATIDGTEALLEGFGTSSGRPVSAL